MWIGVLALCESNKARVEHNDDLCEKDFTCHERDLAFANWTGQLDIAMKDSEELLEKISQ